MTVTFSEMLLVFLVSLLSALAIGLVKNISCVFYQQKMSCLAVISDNAISLEQVPPLVKSISQATTEQIDGHMHKSSTVNVGAHAPDGKCLAKTMQK